VSALRGYPRDVLYCPCFLPGAWPCLTRNIVIEGTPRLFCPRDTVGQFGERGRGEIVPKGLDQIEMELEESLHALLPFGMLPAEIFAKLRTVAEGRGVKLLLLSGVSSTKSQFVNGCLDGQCIDMVKLGASLSPRLAGIGADSIGCEVQDFLNDLHEEGPVFLDEIEMLFDVGMDINVLAVLKYAARTRLMVVNWPGQLDANEGMLYFARGDVQQKSYPLDSEIIVFDDSGVTYPEAV